MMEIASPFAFIFVPNNMSQLRIRCGWKYNRTVYFDTRYIVFEVTKCCDHCPHCRSREKSVGTALLRHGAQYEFFTNAETLTRWVRIERLTLQDPLVYLSEVTDLPIRRVFFEIRRATRNKLDRITTVLMAACLLAAVVWALWEVGTRLFAYLFL